MPSMSGTVDKVVERTVNTKRGPSPVFDVYVNGTKYSWGFDKPTKMGITDGAEIEFQFKQSDYGPKVDVGTVSVITSGSGASPVKAAPKATADKPSFGSSRSDRVFPVPVTSGEIAIIRQNALTNARELVSSYPVIFGCEHDPDAFVQKILEVASTFSDYTSGRDIEQKVAKLTSKMEE